MINTVVFSGLLRGQVGQFASGPHSLTGSHKNSDENSSIEHC